MKLTLKTEALAALSVDELGEVVGGNNYTQQGFTCPVFRCISEDVTCDGCQSLPC